MPWSSEAEAELPSFLSTVDNRIKDQRKPPTPEQVEALEEMEREFDAFTKRSGAHRDTVTAILRRAYQRERRERSEAYARQIATEEEKQDAATLRAIEMFERFIAMYPSDPTYTPDAMFRLGELYFERSAIQFQKDMNVVLDARDQGQELPEPSKDFTQTITLYRTLIERFPEYRRIDGVYDAYRVTSGA